jgi:ClpX C4-type zinc finger
VPDDEREDEEDDEDPFSAPPPGRAQVLTPGSWPHFGSGGPRRCSFCRRREESVRHLVRSRDAYICDQCVDLAAEAIAAASPDAKSLRIPRQPTVPSDDAATEEIERVFETAIGGESTDDERMELIEGGSNLRPTLQLIRQRLPRDQRADTYVEYVRMLSEDEAEVHFVLVYPGGITAPRFPFTGHAVLSDGRWKVARETWCRLIGTIGIPCPPPPE